MNVPAMPIEPDDKHFAPLAQALATALAPVVDDLRLVKVVDFIVYIHDEKLANIQDIVNSSAELYFKAGALAFGWNAGVELDWDTVPVIAFDIEFRHHSVWLVFTLLLHAEEFEVRLKHVSISGCVGDRQANTKLILDAIDDARHPRL